MGRNADRSDRSDRGSRGSFLPAAILLLLAAACLKQPPPVNLDLPAPSSTAPSPKSGTPVETASMLTGQILDLHVPVTDRPLTVSVDGMPDLTGEFDVEAGLFRLEGRIPLDEIVIVIVDPKFAREYRKKVVTADYINTGRRLAIDLNEEKPVVAEGTDDTRRAGEGQIEQDTSK